MASQSKKNKARNSYIHNGGEKINSGKGKGFLYFTKAMRNKIKKDTRDIEEDIENYDDII